MSKEVDYKKRLANELKKYGITDMDTLIKANNKVKVNYGFFTQKLDMKKLIDLAEEIFEDDDDKGGDKE